MASFVPFSAYRFEVDSHSSKKQFRKGDVVYAKPETSSTTSSLKKVYTEKDLTGTCHEVRAAALRLLYTREDGGLSSPSSSSSTTSSSSFTSSPSSISAGFPSVAGLAARVGLSSTGGSASSPKSSSSPSPPPSSLVSSSSSLSSSSSSRGSAAGLPSGPVPSKTLLGCPFCESFQAFSEDELNFHVNNHLNQMESEERLASLRAASGGVASPSPSASSSSSSSSDFSCPRCLIPFRSLAARNTHIEFAHSDTSWGESHAVDGEAGRAGTALSTSTSTSSVTATAGNSNDRWQRGSGVGASPITHRHSSATASVGRETYEESQFFERLPSLAPGDYAHRDFGPAVFDPSSPPDDRPQALSWGLSVATEESLRSGVGTGLWRGIQGAKNSCYIDALLLVLFAFTDSFDAVLLREGPVASEVYGSNVDNLSSEQRQNLAQQLRTLLRTTIVGPLRRRRLVTAAAMARWRRCLHSLWWPDNDVSSPNCEEYDSIDLFNTLHLLLAPDHVPYISFLREGRRETANYLTLWPPKTTAADFTHGSDAAFPTVSELLAANVRDHGLVFEALPRVLVLQLPRDAQGVAFRRLIPDGMLSVTAKPPDKASAAADYELIGIVAIESSHFVGYVRAPFVVSSESTRGRLGGSAGLGPVLTTWLYCNSMADVDGQHGCVPGLERVPELGDDLDAPNRLRERVTRELASHTGSQLYKHAVTTVAIHTKRVLEDSYVLVYERVRSSVLD